MIPDSYFDTFHTAKYKRQNPLQRLLIKRFVAKLSDMFDATQPSESVLEIGCGEGFVAGQLSARQAGGPYVGGGSQRGGPPEPESQVPRRGGPPREHLRLVLLSVATSTSSSVPR